MNQVIGTGIMISPAQVLALTHSKPLSLMLWLLGGLITWAGYDPYSLVGPPITLGLLSQYRTVMHVPSRG